jgi:toxin YoeB
MSRQLTFQERAWNDYLYWQLQDKKTIKRINALIEDISRNGYEGIGSPEPLKGNRSGWWSRKIDSANRIVYRINDKYIEISQCRSHYDE